MRVRPRTLVRVFWRCLFLQAAWNRRGMQNLGFAYAIDPALRALYPEPEKRKEALRRHLGFFNCHPYTAAAIVGGAIHHEERVASGEEPGRAPQAYKATLQGPLAAIGDGFFWTALRPFFGALAVLGTLLVGWPAVVVALVVYNAIHLALRIRLFREGYLLGDAIVGEVASLSLTSLAELLRVGAAALAGLSAAIVVSRGAAHSGGATAVVSLLAAVLGYAALSRGTRLLPAAYAAVALGVGAGLAAVRLHGGP
jgi:PTS system mannose-specific IID component